MRLYREASECLRGASLLRWKGKRDVGKRLVHQGLLRAVSPRLEVGLPAIYGAPSERVLWQPKHRVEIGIE